MTKATKEDLARLRGGMKFALQMEAKLSAVAETIDALQHEDAFIDFDGTLWTYDDFDAAQSPNDVNVAVLGSVGKYWSAMEDAADAIYTARQMFTDKAAELYRRICAIEKAE